MGRIGSHLVGSERLLLNRLAETTAATLLKSLPPLTSFRPAPSERAAQPVSADVFPKQRSLIRKATEQVAAATELASRTQLGLEQTTAQLDTLRSILWPHMEVWLSPIERLKQQSQVDLILEAINEIAQTPVGRHPLLDEMAADFAPDEAAALQIVREALPSLHTARLGGPSGMLAALRTGGAVESNQPLALQIVDEAATRVTQLKEHVQQFAQQTTDMAASMAQKFDLPTAKPALASLDRTLLEAAASPVFEDLPRERVARLLQSER